MAVKLVVGGAEEGVESDFASRLSWREQQSTDRWAAESGSRKKKARFGVRRATLAGWGLRGRRGRRGWGQSRNGAVAVNV